uniref:Uncharacterized protein n=1 Tax=Vespula pensylvanica TaxID=30213 RepID=A0A834UGX4_VESPE|nr:hypothetical protein H0235_001326 [Vespula pensylvanica]
MEEDSGCAGLGRVGMSKVAEDGCETYALLPARGRFLLRNRDTQANTIEEPYYSEQDADNWIIEATGTPPFRGRVSYEPRTKRA